MNSSLVTYIENGIGGSGVQALVNRSQEDFCVLSPGNNVL